MINDKEAHSAFNLSIFQYFNIFIFWGEGELTEKVRIIISKPLQIFSVRVF
jgi:hypothetical protein